MKWLYLVMLTSQGIVMMESTFCQEKTPEKFMTLLSSSHDIPAKDIDASITTQLQTIYKLESSTNKSKLSKQYILVCGADKQKKLSAAQWHSSVSALDVYRIDLSLVVSKYIGETEKNLERVFAAAEKRDYILFFDEADAIFGRSQKKEDSVDLEKARHLFLQRTSKSNFTVLVAYSNCENVSPLIRDRFRQQLILK